MASKKKLKRKSVTELHEARECDCFNSDVRSSEKRCTLRVFPDGWDFTPDVGNSSHRGEVFTPRWVVEKMIVDSGMIPAEAVYDDSYEGNFEKLDSIARSRVNEPALGTANFASVILYHKLRYVESLMRFRPLPDLPISEHENLQLYHSWFATAIASVTAFDVDVGNLQTSKQRLFTNEKSLDDSTAHEYWTNYLYRELFTRPEPKRKPTPQDKRIITEQVAESLEKAVENWSRFMSDGVINVAYYEATGQELPDDFKKLIEEILDKNYLLFNGIKEEDILDADKRWYCPGYWNVNWTWWAFLPAKDDSTLPKKKELKVSLKKMMLQGELENLQREVKELSGPELRSVQKKMGAIEGELYGVGVPGSLFDSSNA